MSLQKKFSEILQVELRRQPLPDADAWHAMIHNCVKVSTDNVTFNFSSMGLNDRVVVAIVETIMRLAPQASGLGLGSSAGGPSTPTLQQQIPGDWILNLANNRLDDRVIDSLCLLMRSTGCVVKVDLSGNQFTPNGISKLSETVGKLAKQPQIFLESGKPITAGRSMPGGEQQVRQPSATGASSVGTGSSSIDIAALRRRRDKMFHEEGLDSSEAALQQRNSLRAEVGVIPPLPNSSSLLGQQRPLGSPSLQPKAPNTPTTKAANPPASAVSEDSKRSAAAQERSSSARSLTAQQAPPQPSLAATTPGPSGKRTGTPTSQKQKESTAKPTGAQGKADGADDTANKRNASTNDTSAEEKTKNSKNRNSKSLSQSIDRDRAQGEPSPPSSTPQGNNEGATDEEAASSAPDETLDRDDISTTATETPDQHDYLDVTLNLGPLDIALSLVAVGLPPADILDPVRFHNVTVLNLAQNGLEYLAALPSSLVRLDVSSNALTRLSGLENCPMLTVLNARRNLLNHISGLERNLNLTHLFLGRNHIRVVDGVAHLWMLEVLDLSYNLIDKESAIRPLSMNPVLHQLMLEGNPLHKKLGNRYKAVLRNLCTPLLVLDSTKLSYNRHADACSKLERSTAALMMPSAAVNATGVPVGYAAPGKVAHSISQIRQKEMEKEKAKSDAKLGKGMFRKRVTREEVVQKLQQQNQSAIEAAVVERLSQLREESMQQSMSRHDPATQQSIAVDHQRRPASAVSQQGAAIGTDRPAPQLRTSATYDSDQWETRRRNAEEAFLRNVSRQASPTSRPFGAESGDGLVQREAITNRLGEIEVPMTPQAAELSFNADAPQNFNWQPPRYYDQGHGAVQQPPAQVPQPYPLLAEAAKRRPHSPQSRKLTTNPKPGQVPSVGADRGKLIFSPSAHSPPDVPPTTAEKVRFSPIRSDLDRTDVSGVEFREQDSSFQSHSAPKTEDEKEADRWLTQLADDAAAAKVALKTLLIVLEAQGAEDPSASPGAIGRGGALPSPGRTAEQQRCIQIIRRGRLTEDTEIPASVLRVCNLTEEELNSPSTSLSTSYLSAVESSKLLMGHQSTATESTKGQVLHLIHSLSDSKTCLRYLIALVDNNRWDLIPRFIAQLRQRDGGALFS
jgi:hypothetical protein